MKEKIKFTTDEKKLIRRYLLWCYKTTKEDLDRVERYFTQLKADHFVLAELSKNPDVKKEPAGKDYLKKIEEFQRYIEKKAERVFPQKFLDQKKGVLQPDYWYLKNRLAALEKAVKYFLGPKELTKIQGLYEEEMARRILAAQEHT